VTPKIKTGLATCPGDPAFAQCQLGPAPADKYVERNDQSTNHVMLKDSSRTNTLHFMKGIKLQTNEDERRRTKTNVDERRRTKTNEDERRRT